MGLYVVFSLYEVAFYFYRAGFGAYVRRVRFQRLVGGFLYGFGYILFARFVRFRHDLFRLLFYFFLLLRGFLRGEVMVFRF